MLECKAEQPVWRRIANGANKEACFARATQLWLAVNHNTSVTSGEWIRCSKRIARASDLGSCQSNSCQFMRDMNNCFKCELLIVLGEDIHIPKTNLYANKYPVPEWNMLNKWYNHLQQIDGVIGLTFLTEWTAIGLTWQLLLECYFHCSES